MTIKEVLQAVHDGQMTAADALQQEKQGDNRSTLINALEKLVQAQNDGGNDQLEEAARAAEEAAIAAEAAEAAAAAAEVAQKEKENATRPPEPISVVFTKNTKHNGKYYTKGGVIDVSPEDYKILLAAEVIKAEE